LFIRSGYCAARNGQKIKVCAIRHNIAGILKRRMQYATTSPVSKAYAIRHNIDRAYAIRPVYMDGIRRMQYATTSPVSRAYAIRPYISFTSFLVNVLNRIFTLEMYFLCNLKLNVMKNSNRSKKPASHLIAFAAIIIFVFAAKSNPKPDPIKITTTRPPQTIILSYQPEEAVDATSLGSIIQTAKLAIDGLDADAAAEATEVATATRDVKDKNADYQKTSNEYSDKLAPYNQKLDIYNSHLAPYKTELARYTGEVNSYNGLPQDQRDQGTYSHLVTWKGQLDVKKSQLDNERAPLMEEKTTVLDPLFSSLQQKKDALNSSVNKLNALKDDMGNAYRQLLYCKEYVGRAYKIAADRNWSVPNYRTSRDFFGSVKANPSLDLLNSELEKMKKDTDIPWDGAK
jgi:hypothetical protein